MKKMKKVLAILLGTVAASSVIGSMHAEAMTYFIDDPFTVPESYEEYEDTEGLLAWVGGNTGYIAYREDIDGSVLYHVYYSYKYNHTTFTVVNEKIEEFDAIYEKYSTELDMDYYKRDNPPLSQPDYDVTAMLFDCYDENGNWTKNPAVMEDKSALIQEMTAELYASGCILEADYMGVTASAGFGYHATGINVFLNSGTAGAEMGALESIASQFSSGGKVYYYEATDYYSIRIDSYEADNLMRAIKEVYPEAYGNMGLFQSSTDTVSTGNFDMLAALEETGTTGDVNADGTTDITDAMLILQHYAESAASSVAAVSETNMDVNGDGSVDLDDAAAVLQIYAENAAGVNAS